MSITSMYELFPDTYTFTDPELDAHRVRYKEAMSSITPAQREQVEWVSSAIPRAWDRIWNTGSKDSRPAMVAVNSGRCAEVFKDVVWDVVHWLGVRHAERDPSSPVPSSDERLDMIDKASKWLVSRGLVGLPMTVRQMLKKADACIDDANKVASTLSKEELR